MRTRILAIATIATLAIGMTAGPAGAAGTTRYVDDDGTAGANGCNGTASVPSTIGAALASAGAGDTILVCPGVYREQVTVSTNGVTLRAVKKWKAVVSPKHPGGGAIITVTAKNVTVQWLKVLAPTIGSCDTAGAGIVVNGAAGARIVSNRVLASSKGDTLYGSCGMQQGIVVAGGSTGARVAHNIVRDFKLVGIIAHDANAQVINNSVQYWHLGSACTAALACVTASVSPAIPVVPTGVRVYQSTGLYDLNAVSSAPEGRIAVFRLQQGVSVFGSDGPKVRKNYVVGSPFGILIEASTNAVVARNVVIGVLSAQATRKQAARTVAPASLLNTGIAIVSGAGNTVRDNHALMNTVGGYANSGTNGNTFTDNDFTGNSVDCEDWSIAPASEIANTWTDNLGNTDNPVGLCTDAGVQTNPGSPT